MAEPIRWSDLYRCRKAVRRRYRRVWHVPLARRPEDVARRALADRLRLQASPARRHRLVADDEEPPKGGVGELRVLEVGAGERRLAGRLRAWFPGLVYESMDVDRGLPHDYYSLEAVQGPYDAVILFEVLEHLPLAEGFRLLASVREVLRPGGALIASTPNVFNPSRFWRDATHLVAYAYDELGGLITMSGYELRGLVRTHNDPVVRLVLRRYVFGWLFRLLNLDFADSIVAVAERTQEKPSAISDQPTAGEATTQTAER